MYYKNNDYTARAVTRDGVMRYFIRFHGVLDSQEVEVDAEMFALYMAEFKWPLERDRNEKRRHIQDGHDMEEFGVPSFEAESLLRCDIEAVLQSCTPAQQRRFRLHIEEHSFAEIARFERCTERAIRKSVEAVKARVKTFFEV